MTQAHVYIKGDVIEVGFRAWTKIQAKVIGITGWARNVYNKPEVFEDGQGVEAVFQGKDEDVRRMIETVRQGSPISRVDDVDVIWQEPKEFFEEFEIRK